MVTTLRRFLILVISITMLVACGTPPPPPTSTVVPTKPLTSTPIPPTAVPTKPLATAPISPMATSTPANMPVPPTANARSVLEGKRILALAIDPATPTTLYAGTSDGVFKSTDGGENWSVVNIGLPLTETAILAWAIDPVTPTTLYAVTGGGPPKYAGVFKSTDGGKNWSAVNTGLTNLR